ncbi:MAG TPA: 2'-5' RNA ligase family protein, partial [Limnochordia bacterium]
MRRCIFAVVELSPAEPIARLRARFDPLYERVPPHITLVFPFERPIPVGAIAGHMERAVAGVAPFTVTFGPCVIDNTYA